MLTVRLITCGCPALTPRTLTVSLPENPLRLSSLADVCTVALPALHARNSSRAL